MPKDKDLLSIEIDQDISSYEWWGFSYKTLRKEMRGFSGTKIHVPINSYGGEVLEGTSIYQTLYGFNNKAEGRQVTTKVIGYAISMGSVIFCAGDIREVPKGSHIMIHEPWTWAAGDHEDLEHSAEVLDMMGDQIAEIYANTSKRSGKAEYDKKFWRGLMAKETWLTSKEAVKYGLATKRTDGIAFNSLENHRKFYASLDKSKYKNIPEINFKSKDKKKKTMAFNWKSFLNIFMSEDNQLKEDDTEVSEKTIAENFAASLTETVSNAVVEKMKGAYASKEDFDAQAELIKDNEAATEILAERIKKVEGSLKELLDGKGAIEDKAKKEQEANAARLKRIADKLNLEEIDSGASPSSVAIVKDDLFQERVKGASLNEKQIKEVLKEELNLID